MGRVIGRRSLAVVLCCTLTALLGGCPPPNQAREDELQDISVTWIRLALEATRVKGQGPTAEARKLWQVAATMYEAWAAYDDTASGYFKGKTLKAQAGEPTIENVAETLSHAVYPVLREGFKFLANAPAGTEQRAAYDAFENKMIELGYFDASGNTLTSDAQELGAKIGKIVVEFCKTDKANEPGGYADNTGYVNATTVLELPFQVELDDVNLWQQIRLPNGAQQSFLTPHWCFVTPFALPAYVPNGLRLDPGSPPYFGTESQQEFIDNFLEVAIYSASLDPNEGLGTEVLNISPGARGNNTFPYDNGTGHAINPFTKHAYPDNFAKRGDYYRAQAAFLDGNRFNMPSPWWFQIAADVVSGTELVQHRPANKQRKHDLEYDVKTLFAVGGAEHDTGIAIWDIKRVYDWVRPITAIRWLGQEGLLPLTPGVVEIIAEGDPLAGENDENVGTLKLKGWLGPHAGVGWILPEEWFPYQNPTFVTPPFPGYTSGHAGFGTAFSVVMEHMTQDEFVPGGLMEWKVTQLPFDGPVSQPVYLQWATYRDVADDGGIGRLMCGVHPYVDTIGSRTVGREVGRMAVARAEAYFNGTAEGVIP